MQFWHVCAKLHIFYIYTILCSEKKCWIFANLTN